MSEYLLGASASLALEVACREMGRGRINVRGTLEGAGGGARGQPSG